VGDRFALAIDLASLDEVDATDAAALRHVVHVDHNLR